MTVPQESVYDTKMCRILVLKSYQVTNQRHLVELVKKMNIYYCDIIIKSPSQAIILELLTTIKKFRSWALEYILDKLSAKEI
ncbi:hypothetical protein GLOIN_2v1607109 [Rhizophagus irregularis DAOM 181602=DAOM 197198]|uniref:Uncharacterized protein n=1 Tax=Rhizophagus irregularis (strain DAOM 181602 / DAOM 197198 / MUCL 43194) TaxID=747089 RepID=A0A2P4Q166_RHIID|nr:hypothetical protein GLOIN_2v1607109 [Rhizophagus irregularis DAOM 181602=DAOM 197198]POG71352.1 hypothetical protein GLOIN_2v1607109 [Rhizophagus irregularis DAOM 181602=DAOM 197198]GET59718.1 hypothetical protein GLOIN_2v1607109 [Rhizophagus irregularis DAOM 181602=DAOM 197198]|eukprot:XP_025178218.1 hypothetical protein GLOIN_2v1607109 [Rhizophagus irregularis DAOM 181602=DAOM 197198]